MRKLIIVGAGEFGHIAYEAFQHDTEYDVSAFCVEKSFANSVNTDKPVIEFEKIREYAPPNEYDVFIAITHTNLNHERARLYNTCKRQGYHFASYISPHSFIGHHCKTGENVFIFESVTVQYYAEIGNCCVLWPGSVVAHRSIINDYCWLAPSVAVAGCCRVGKYCFLATNCTIGDNVHIPDKTVIGAASCIVKSPLKGEAVYVGIPGKLIEGKSPFSI